MTGVYGMGYTDGKGMGMGMGMDYVTCGQAIWVLLLDRRCHGALG
jgi:hypothetical protein